LGVVRLQSHSDSDSDIDSTTNAHTYTFANEYANIGDNADCCAYRNAYTNAKADHTSARTARCAVSR